MKTYTHIFDSLSDCSNFCEQYSAVNLGDGVARLDNLTEEQKNDWEEWEAYGPFPCDLSDFR